MTLSIRRYQDITALCQIQQNGTGFKNGDLAIGQPRHLRERLKRKPSLRIVERRCRDSIRQPRLLRRPADTQIANVTTREVRHPV